MKPILAVDRLALVAACIEKEREIVESNRELIRVSEEKVRKVIERVWEG